MRRAGDPGLSLLEVVVAGVILTLCFTPFFLLFQGSLGRVKLSRPQMVAGVLAGEVMDQMRLVPFASLPTTAPIALDLVAGKALSVPVYADAQRRIPLLVGTYPVDFKLGVVAAPLGTGLAGVKVSVSFNKASQGPPEYETFELTEYVANRLARGDL